MSNTPLNKRLWTEMSFSPEGQDETEQTSLCDLLSKMLDDKFKEYLTPVKDDISSLKASMETKQIENGSRFDKIEEHCKQLQAENNALKDKLNKLETFQRKNNLRVVGLSETKGEMLEVRVLALFNGLLNKEYQFDSRTLERVHRLGPYRKGFTRPVILRFANYKDKLSSLEMRKPLKDKHNILLFEDLPKDLDEKQKQLNPVFKALKHVQTSGEGDIVRDVKLKAGQLVLNGDRYNVEDLHKLPEDVSLGRLFTRTKNDVTAFFRSFSKFSNHFKCNFTVDSVEYSSMEKYLMAEKARRFGDTQMLVKIMDSDDPEVIKRHGHNIKNLKKANWMSDIEAVLTTGLSAKFRQNEDLRELLQTTGTNILAEANPHDKVFGIGLSLQDARVFDVNEWPGQNRLGKALMIVRDTL